MIHTDALWFLETRLYRMAWYMCVIDFLSFVSHLDMSIGHFAGIPFHGLSSSGPWNPETSQPCTLLSDQGPCL